MTTEDLKCYFGDPRIFEAKTNSRFSFGEDECIEIIKKKNAADITIKKSKGSTAYDMQSYRFTLTWQKDIYDLDSIVMANSYLAFISKVDTVNSTVFFAVYKTNNPSILADSVPIAVLDSAIKGGTFEYFTERLLRDYTISCGEKAYFIKGFYGAGDNASFSMLRADTQVDVKHALKGACGIPCDDIMSEVLVIDSPEKSKNTRIQLTQVTLCEWKFVLTDFSTAKIKKSEALEFSKKGLDKYIRQWKRINELERIWVERRIQDAGILKCRYLEGQDGTMVFRVESSPEKFERFISAAHSFGTGIDARITIDKTYRRSSIDAYLDLVLSRGNTIYCKKESQSSRISSSRSLDTNIETHTIEISTAGFDAIFSRRSAAFERIDSGNTANPDLPQLLEGITRRQSNREIINGDYEDILAPGEYFEFGATPNQREAIRIAVNTPDIAIIQGPPGAGKTSVINAIKAILDRFDANRKTEFGKNILTAYQNVATENLARGSYVRGFPIKSLLGTSGFDQEVSPEVQDWINEMIKNVRAVNPDITGLIEENIEFDAFLDLKSQLDKMGNSYELLRAYLQNIKNKLRDRIIGNHLDADYQQLCDRLEIEAPKEREELLINILLSKAYNIPENERMYSDKGDMLAQSIISFFGNPGIVPSGMDLSKETELLKKVFGSEPVDFNVVKQIKIRILCKIKARNPMLLKPQKSLIRRIESFLLDVEQTFPKTSYSDEEEAILSYLTALEYDAPQINHAINKYATVIAATHQQIASAEFRERKGQKENVTVDNVIVDEAARSCPPDLLIPLSCARKRIIMVGDHKQLPQFVNDEVAKDYCKQNDLTSEERYNIKNISMFEHLTEKCQALTETDGIRRFIMLDTQFRMCKYLGDIISKHFYEPDGRKLESGVPDEKFHHNLPGIENKCLVWLDAGIRPEVHLQGRGYFRLSEAQAIARQIAKYIKSPTGSKYTYGIISLYQEQVKRIKNELASPGIDLLDSKGIVKKEYSENLKFVGTVDACQGLQFDVVFVSLVRTYNPVWSNPDSYAFLNDQHRLCVALSRQKKVLCVSGSSTIIKDEVAPSAVRDIYRRCCDTNDEHTAYIPFPGGDQA